MFELLDSYAIDDTYTMILRPQLSRLAESTGLRTGPVRTAEGCSFLHTDHPIQWPLAAPWKVGK